MAKKELVKREIELIGKIEGEDKCPACEEADTFITERIKNKDNITYKKRQINDDIAEEKKIESMPYIKDCKVYKSDTGKESKRCTEIEGFDASDFDDL